MTREDIAAAKANRKSTLKSIKAKRESRIKSIQERAAEEIRQVNIEFAEDPERLKAKYAADAAYKSEREKRRSERALKRAEIRAAHQAAERLMPRQFSFGEEIFNSITLGIGAGLSIAAIVLLINRAVVYSPVAVYARSITSFALVGSFLFLVYLMSTLAHALTPYGAKQVFRVLSYDCGYACYTSVLSLCALVPVGGKAGWVLFGIDWLLAVLAVSLYSTLEGKVRSIAMKIIDGFLICALTVELVLLYPHIHTVCFKMLIMALVSYLIGELFHAMKKVKWTNPIFHLFNLMAITFVFFALFLMLPLSE